MRIEYLLGARCWPYIGEQETYSQPFPLEMYSVVRQINMKLINTYAHIYTYTIYTCVYTHTHIYIHLAWYFLKCWYVRVRMRELTVGTAGNKRSGQKDFLELQN